MSGGIHIHISDREKVVVGQEPRATDTIKDFELTPVPTLLMREGDQEGEFISSGLGAPCS